MAFNTLEKKKKHGKHYFVDIEMRKLFYTWLLITFLNPAFSNDFQVFIEPVGNQKLAPFENGIALFAIESELADFRQWKYSHVSGGPYNYIIEGAVDTVFVPNFQKYNSYYLVCVSTIDSISYFSNEVRIDVPLFSSRNGLPIENYHGGAAEWIDYNNDGNVDIFLPQNPPALYKNLGDGFFEEQSDIQFAGIEFAFATAWGDINNDGTLDMAIYGKYLDKYSRAFPILKVYLNIGGDRFTELLSFTVEDIYDCSLEWADFNNDGFRDLYIQGSHEYENSSRIYINSGSNGFLSPYINLRAGDSYLIADFNEDGFIDILTKGLDINAVNHATFHFNDGHAEFTTVDAEMNHIEEPFEGVKDFNHDGYLDIQTTENVYVSHEGQAFSEWEVPLPELGEGGSQSWADINNDGYYDVLFHQDTNSVVFLNEGDSIFTICSVEIIAGGEGSWIDYDQDGDLDLMISITTLDSSENIGSRIYENNSNSGNNVPGYIKDKKVQITEESVTLYWDTVPDNETFTQNLSYDLFIGSSPNLVEFKSPANNSYRGYSRTGIIGNAGYSKSYEIFGLEPGEYYWAVQALDNINRGIGFGQWSIFRIETLFSEPPGVSFPDFYRCSASWGDYNHDGYQDLVVSGWGDGGDYRTTIFRNNREGGFDAINAGIIGLEYSSLDWGDYDNDGDLDLAISGKTSTSDPISKIYKNLGNGDFDELENLDIAGIYHGATKWGDYDNDGDLDLLLAGNLIVKIYENLGLDQFREHMPNDFDGVHEASAAWGDYDNDFDLDVVICGFHGSDGESTKLYENKGEGVFLEQSQYDITGVANGSLAWGDCDNDSDLDLLLTGFDSIFNPVTEVYINETSGFTKLDGNYRKVGFSSCAWGDYNNDGLLDFVISGQSGGVISRLYRNNGDGSFSEVNSDLNGIQFGDLDFGDFDNDGDPDLVVSGDMGGQKATHIFRNNAYSINEAPLAPEKLRSRTEDYNIFLSWDPAKDEQSLNGGLTYNLRIGTSPGGSELMSPSSDKESGFRNVSEMGNVQSNLGWRIDSIPAGRYYWSVQAVDQGFIGGSWADEEVFTIEKVRVDFQADEVCFGQANTFIDNTLPQQGISYWNWEFGDGTASEMQNPKYIFKSPGYYNVTLIIGMEGKEYSRTKSIYVKPIPIVNFSISDTCIGKQALIQNKTDTVSLSVTNWKWNFGDGNYSSEIQPASHGYINPGYYEVSLEAEADNGCISESNHGIQIIPIPGKSMTTSGDLCPNGNYTLEVDSNEFFNYQWSFDGYPIPEANSPILSPAYEGSYSVKISSVCGTVFQETEVRFLDAPEKPDLYIRGPEVWILACSNDSADVYQWYKDDILISGANEAIYVPNQQLGVYQVRISDGGECYTISDPVRIPQSLTGLYEDPFAGLNIYPNPTSGIFNIEMDCPVMGDLLIDIITEQGSKILSTKFQKETSHFTAQVDLSDQPAGVYLIGLRIGKIKTDKILILE